MLEAFMVERCFVEAIASLYFAKIRRDKLYIRSTDEQMDRQNISCILQVIVPLGPLPKKEEERGQRRKERKEEIRPIAKKKRKEIRKRRMEEK